MSEYDSSSESDGAPDQWCDSSASDGEETERQFEVMRERRYGAAYKEGMDGAVDAAVQPGFEAAFARTAPSARLRVQRLR